MIPTRSALATVLLMGLCACGGAVSQLDGFKTDQASGDWVRIAATPVNEECLAAGQQPSEACAQVFAIHGRACHMQAQAEAAKTATCPPATPTARRNLTCAIDDLTRALASRSLAAADAETATENRALALYCSANLAAAPKGLEMARQAAADLSRLASTPRRDHLAANVALYVAEDAQLAVGDRCQQARTAAALAKRGLGANPPSDLADGLRGAANAAAIVARGLPNCEGN